MKRIIAVTLSLLLLISLSACRKNAEPAPTAQDTQEAQSVQETESSQGTESTASDPAAEEAAEAPFPEEMIGSWILVDSNDTELTEQTFPGVKETGGTMEIGADGLLFWTIGTASGSGNLLEVQGDEVSAQFRTGSGTAEPVHGLLESSNEALAFYLHYSGVDLIWVHVQPKAE